MMTTEEPPVIPHHFFSPVLKQTTPINFLKVLGRGVQGEDARNLLGLLTSARTSLLTYIHSPPLHNSSYDDMLQSCSTYLSLLLGFIAEPQLRKVMDFSWTNIIGLEKKTKMKDTQFDLCSILLSCANWMVSRASSVACKIKDSNAEELHKELYHLLLRAGGVVIEVEEQVKELKGQKPIELSPEILSVYKDMILAMAQEISINRAQIKGNKPSLIAKLCMDVHNKYSALYYGLNVLSKSKGSRVFKVRSYAKYKMYEYQALTYNYTAIIVSETDSENGAGLAVAACKKALELISLADQSAESYTNFEPETDINLVRKELSTVRKIIQKTHNMKKMENDHIHYQKVDSLPDLPKGIQLCKPSKFDMAQVDGSWEGLYESFQGVFTKGKVVKNEKENEEGFDVVEKEDEKEKETGNQKKNTPKKTVRKEDSNCTIL
ncbi:bro1 domain-containing protein brox [Anaeramoeba flamelloides]|uniref:Bro1 domain-containing protein brox n=1 Tax=Anaeramoeba flamelloides TaxID=1746091 RepID=A0ABQ8XLS2_9EUKA|nr:bro1 domain-containing protein brox [Anaeramoeba flamelloides]